MTKVEFTTTFLEGVSMPWSELSALLLSKLYDERKSNKELHETIEFMNDVARDSGWSMTCRSCQKEYQPDCELSEMFGSENYCGGSQWCTP